MLQTVAAPAAAPGGAPGGPSSPGRFDEALNALKLVFYKQTCENKEAVFQYTDASIVAPSVRQKERKEHKKRKKERRAALLLHRCAKAARKAEALKRKEERRARKAEALEQELLSKTRHTATVLFKRHTATTNKRHTMRTQEAQEEAQEARYDVLADW